MNKRLSTLLCTALVSIPLYAVAAEIDSKAPDCALTSLGDTQRHNLQQFHGKVVYVDFWASWCPPCAKSFPFLNALERDFKDRGLQVIGVNLDQSPEDATAFLGEYPADFTVAADAGEQCAMKFDVKAMPSSYLIDRKGVIRHIHLGFRDGAAEELRLAVEQLLAESPELASSGELMTQP